MERHRLADTGTRSRRNFCPSHCEYFPSPRFNTVWSVQTLRVVSSPIRNRESERGLHFKTCKYFRLTLIDTNIWAAFREIGLSFDGIGDVQGVLFDEITLRESRGLQEPWMMDDPLENLSTWPGNAQYARIEKLAQNNLLDLCSILSQGT
jgi:hypothetical protein